MYKILFGLIYTAIYWFLALLNAGPEANGTMVFIAPSLSWLFIFVALFFSSKLNWSISKFVFVGAMAAHYGMTLFIVCINWTEAEKMHFLKSWHKEPGVMLFTFMWYLMGQLIIWFFFVKGLRAKLPKELS
jgi:hypothetical protein